MATGMKKVGNSLVGMIAIGTIFYTAINHKEAPPSNEPRSPYDVPTSVRTDSSEQTYEDSKHYKVIEKETRKEYPEEFGHSPRH